MAPHDETSSGGTPEEGLGLARAATRIDRYRLLDATFGVLETAQQVHHEIMMTRLTQIRSRQAALQGQLVLVLIVLIGAIPTFYQIIPEESRADIWLWICGILAFVYLLYLVVALIGQCKESAALQKLDPRPTSARVEHTPAFIMMRISSFGTRLSMANSILQEELPAELKLKFVAATAYWRNRLETTRDDVSRLRTSGALSANDFKRLQEWINLTSQPSEV